jgi:hypothetical protein
MEDGGPTIPIPAAEPPLHPHLLNDLASIRANTMPTSESKGAYAYPSSLYIYDPGKSQTGFGAVFLSEGIQKFLFPDQLGAGRFLKIGLPAPDFLGPFVGTFEIGGSLVRWGSSPVLRRSRCSPRLAANLPLP